VAAVGSGTEDFFLLGADFLVVAVAGCDVVGAVVGVERDGSMVLTVPPFSTVAVLSVSLFGTVFVSMTVAPSTIQSVTTNATVFLHLGRVDARPHAAKTTIAVAKYRNHREAATLT
jgi:hypothetical protein